MDLESLRERLASYLDRYITPLFVNPKITLIVRAPQLPDGDVVVTEDNFDEIVAALGRLRDKGKPASPVLERLLKIEKAAEALMEVWYSDSRADKELMEALSREVSPECPGCSESAGNSVRHMPPACRTSDQPEKLEKEPSAKTPTIAELEAMAERGEDTTRFFGNFRRGEPVAGRRRGEPLVPQDKPDPAYEHLLDKDIALDVGSAATIKFQDGKLEIKATETGTHISRYYRKKL